MSDPLNVGTLDTDDVFEAARSDKTEKRNFLVKAFSKAWHGTKDTTVDIAKNLHRVDTNYGWTIIKASKQAGEIKGDQLGEQWARHERGAAAREEATKHREGVTYAEIAREWNRYQEIFQHEMAACQAFADKLADFQSMDIISQTQHGKDALNKADLILRGVVADAVKVFENEFWEFRKKVVSKMKDSGADSNGLAYQDYVIDWAELRGRHSGRVEEGKAHFTRIVKLCDDALKFEVIKAYLKATPEEMPAYKKQIDKAFEVAGDGVEFTGSTGGQIPELPGTIIGTVAALGASIVAFADKQQRALIYAQQVKKIQAEQGGYDRVMTKMNQDPMIVAKYLAEKYVINLQYALDQVDVLVFAAATGLGAVPAAGQALNPIVSELWPPIKIVLVKVAKKFQQERIDQALEGQRTKKETPEAIKAAFEATWKRMGDAVRDELEKEITPEVGKAAKRAAKKVLSAKKTITSVATDPIVNWCTEFLLNKVPIDPAQLLTGDDVKQFSASMQDLADSYS